MHRIPKVIHTLPDIDLRSGGPSVSVCELSRFLNSSGCTESVVLSQRRTDSTVFPNISPKVLLANGSRPMVKTGIPLAVKMLSLSSGHDIDIIHNHGLWHGANHWASYLARLRKIPCILHPHGMLEPWALNHNNFKKRLALALYQGGHLRSADAFIASAEMELESIRSLGFQQPIAVIPNGISLGDGTIRPKNSNSTRERRVLFLSRIHPKKGLINLLQAWSQLDVTGWKLAIAGPPEAGHLAEVMTEIQRLNISKSVEYLGELYGDAKEKAYSAADVFVLPTFSENFGIVVAEALAHRLPVITTKGAPWSGLESTGSGWWVDIGSAPLKLAIADAISLSDSQRREMGERGYSFVRTFSWPDIAHQTAAFYTWLIAGGDKPSFVHLS